MSIGPLSKISEKCKNPVKKKFSDEEADIFVHNLLFSIFNQD
jgi:hypothetical protein